MGEDKTVDKASKRCVLSCYGCFNSKNTKPVDVQDLQYERAEDIDAVEHEEKLESKLQKSVSQPAIVTKEIFPEPISEDKSTKENTELIVEEMENLRESKEKEDLVVKTDDTHTKRMKEKI